MKKKLFYFVIIIIIIIIVVNVINNKKSNVEYEIANIDTYKYVRYKEDNKYGVLDREGNKIIEASYFKIEIPNPSKDIFLCHEDENAKITVLNANKDTLFKKYDNVEAIKIKNIASTLCYEKTVLKYKKNNKYGLIDFSGKEITKNKYDEIENLLGTEGKMQVSINGKYGVINQNGTVLVDCKHNEIKTDGYYDAKTKYAYAGFIVSENDGKYGYIDYTGKRILKNEYQSLHRTKEGAIVIQKDQKYGIANLKGNVKIKPKYEEYEEKGIYVYMRTSKENDVYNVEGNKIDINFNKTIFNTENENYKITTILNNGVTYYGVESKEGKTLIDCKYKYIEYLWDNYFIVQKENNNYGVVNSNCVEKMKFKYDFMQKIKNKKILQVRKKDSKKAEFFDLNFKRQIKMKNAKVQDYSNYIEISNNNEKKYLDREGNIIEEDSEIIKNELKKELPEKIGKYKKTQYSLEDVYYQK